MRIVDSRIYAGVTHSALAATEISESLRLWAGEPGSAPRAAAEDRVSLSTEGSRRQKRAAGSCSPCIKAQTDAEDLVGSHLWLAKLIIEAFTGINLLQGTVRASGFYLREGGGAGSIQQIDFAV